VDEQRSAVFLDVGQELRGCGDLHEFECRAGLGRRSGPC
jgi:hypothetical protein